MAFLIVWFSNLIPTLFPTPPNVRFAAYKGFTIRHTRSTGLVELLNRHGKLRDSWTCTSFHRAVREARARIGNPEVLNNPWVQDLRRGGHEDLRNDR